MNEHREGERPRRISRRTVAKGTAWAAPMIAVGVAAPAYAASGEILTGNGAACKLPGNSQGLYKGYALGFEARNTFDDPLTITFISMTLNGDSLGNLRIINLDGPCAFLGTNSFTIPAHTNFLNLVVLTEGAGNSQAGTLAVTYTISGGPGGEVTTSAAVGTTPPIQGGSCTGFTSAEKACIEGQNRAA